MIFRDRIIPWRQSFDPGTIAIASVATSLIGAGVSAMGQMQQGQAAAAQANYQRQMALNNQILMQRNADMVRQQGAVDAMNSQNKTAQIMAGQRAALAAQGGDVNSGSPLDIVSDTARAGATDVSTIRYNAALKAYGYESAAAGAGASANAYGMAASNAVASLPYGVGSTLLGGISSAGSKWYDYMRTNPSGGGYGPAGGVVG